LSSLKNTSFKLYSSKDVTDFFGCSRQTLHYCIKKGIVRPRRRNKPNSKNYIFTTLELQKLLDYFFPYADGKKE
jgi:DNA-binding transcriptional MerR regulator